jgi:hypothetical protein
VFGTAYPEMANPALIWLKRDLNPDLMVGVHDRLRSRHISGGAGWASAPGLQRIRVRR